MDRLIVLDTETSGLGEDSAVCEIAFLEFDRDFNVLQKHRSLIDPQCPISPAASGIHRITNDMVKDEPTLDEYFHDVLGNPFGDAKVLMVAHNAAFDIKYVHKYFSSYEVLCTLKLARIIYPDAPDHKLATLKYMLSLGDGGFSHTALADVEDCFGLLNSMREEANLDLDGLIRLSRTPIKIEVMPFGKHKGVALEKLPKGYVQWLFNLDNLDDNLRWSLEQL